MRDIFCYRNFYGLVLLVFCLNAGAQQLHLADMNRLALLKEKASNDAGIREEINALSKQADKLLTVKILSVVDKKISTPCGNPHEYMSMASYYWPDPSKPDGLPYIRKDGERNPENAKVTDHEGFDQVISYVTDLSWAYYFTGKQAYADKAVELTRFWFLDTATYMLPNLNHGQVIRGIDTGRGIGIIDIHMLPQLLDALSLLEYAHQFKQNDQKALHQWFNHFLDWLMTSKNGMEEAATKNNHKTFYETLVASFALYTGRDEIAIRIFKNAEKLMAAQFTPEGKQPLELERTNSLSYSTFNLKAWCMLATMAGSKGVDLWNYTTPDGKSIRLALNFILPYATGKEKWEYQQIGKYDDKELYSVLAYASGKYADPVLLAEVNKLASLANPLQRILFR